PFRPSPQNAVRTAGRPRAGPRASEASIRKISPAKPALERPSSLRTRCSPRAYQARSRSRVQRWVGPAGMGPTGPSATEGALLLLFLLRRLLLHRVTSLPVPARPAVVGYFWTLGEEPRPCQGENTGWRGQDLPYPHIWGRLRLLLSRGRLAMLLPLHEFLIEGDALLAERAAVRGIGREIPADQAEDLLAADLGLLRPAPERADPHDLASEVLHELGEESDGGAGADQVLDDEHLGALADQPVELGGQGDPALAAAHALGAVDEDRAGGMGPGHAVRQDESAGAGGQDHVDGPRGEVLGDDGPEPLREGGLGGDQGLLDVLARVLARGEQDVVIGVVGARALE